jgi:hypothetical protein
MMSARRRRQCVTGTVRGLLNYQVRARRMGLPPRLRVARAASIQVVAESLCQCLLRGCPLPMFWQPLSDQDQPLSGQHTAVSLAGHASDRGPDGAEVPTQTRAGQVQLSDPHFTPGSGVRVHAVTCKGQASDWGAIETQES